MLEKFAVKYHAAFIKLTILFVLYHTFKANFKAAILVIKDRPI
ncbi:hypothetical protein SAMN05216283_11329 [Sunxiuqinia elliptica]|uniref:Uncharacterized protein n=1 Tax=Sunxiuqinia elliptica TaxID=655355 RepID=A0A1I2KRU0_9BACT|nr:hypothetical protein SAMN05216283_11329 [Sunxiuqinia elliptica]